MDTQAIVAELRATGLAVIEPLSVTQLADVRDHFDRFPVFVDAHVPQTARNRGDHAVMRSDPRAQASECVCVLYDHVTTAPHLIERALALTDVAAAYLERDPPVMYSANAFWTRPGAAPLRHDIQAFHRDADDTRFLAMFVYLSAVFTPADGQHELEGPDGVIRHVNGPAGTVFLADTHHLHRGLKPQSRERGMLWFRWGVSDQPPAGQWDKVMPVPRELMGDRYPADPRLRESVKLLVA